MNIDDILIALGADPLLEGAAPTAFRRAVMRRAEKAAAQMIMEATPESLRGWRRLPQASLLADGEGKVTLTLPPDFLRLLSLRLSCWQRPVRETLMPDHWLRRLQGHRWTGLCGCPGRPLAFLTAADDGCLALELFSASPGESVTIAEGWYMPMPRFDETGHLSPDPPGDIIGRIAAEL